MVFGDCAYLNVSGSHSMGRFLMCIHRLIGRRLEPTLEMFLILKCTQTGPWADFNSISKLIALGFILQFL